MAECSRTGIVMLNEPLDESSGILLAKRAARSDQTVYNLVARTGRWKQTDRFHYLKAGFEGSWSARRNRRLSISVKS
jgi:hypothetical protein